MKIREKLIGILTGAATNGLSLNTRIETEKLADLLLKNSVTVLSEDEIILTRKEIEALSRYEENRKTATCSTSVVHGRWMGKKKNDPLYVSKNAPHCSVCNYMSFIRYDYCPNCGAKMDAERREG